MSKKPKVIIILDEDGWPWMIYEGEGPDSCPSGKRKENPNKAPSPINKKDKERVH